MGVKGSGRANEKGQRNDSVLRMKGSLRIQEVLESERRAGNTQGSESKSLGVGASKRGEAAGKHRRGNFRVY